MVRRARHIFAWIALIGVLLQGAASGWALSVLTAGAVDPIADVPICSDHPKPNEPDTPQDRHAALCPICQIACCAASVIAPDPAVFPCPTGRALIAFTRYAIAAPRGPPRRSPQARAPPLFR